MRAGEQFPTPGRAARTAAAGEPRFFLVLLILLTKIGENVEVCLKGQVSHADVLNWFESQFKHYLMVSKIYEYKLHMNSIWINEMKAGEYNPIHIHQGTIFTGLSSVLILKLPKDMGPEYARPDQPMNGKLQIIGSASGQFVKSDYSPKSIERDFYIRVVIDTRITLNAE